MDEIELRYSFSSFVSLWNSELRHLVFSLVSWRHNGVFHQESGAAAASADRDDGFGDIFGTGFEDLSDGEEGDTGEEAERERHAKVGEGRGKNKIEIFVE